MACEHLTNTDAIKMYNSKYFNYIHHTTVYTQGANVSRYQCLLCGHICCNMWAAVKHVINKHETETRTCKPTYITTAKPWEDPESLFCSTEFLDKLCKKKLLDVRT